MQSKKCALWVSTLASLRYKRAVPIFDVAPSSIIQWLESFGQLGAITAVVLAMTFIVAAFLPVPRTILVIGSGAAFGVNSLYVVVPSATTGCILAFIVSRGLLRRWFEQQADARPTLRLIAQAVDEEGWRIAALMRFWGPVPNCVQNYLFGLTKIRLLPYAVITLLFTFPQILLYTYIGASGRALLDGEIPFNSGFTALAVAVAVVVIYLVTRRVRLIVSVAARRQRN